MDGYAHTRIVHWVSHIWAGVQDITTAPYCWGVVYIIKGGHKGGGGTVHGSRRK